MDLILEEIEVKTAIKKLLAEPHPSSVTRTYDIGYMDALLDLANELGVDLS